MLTLSNDIISIEVSEHGAEMMSLKRNSHEYLWQGDPQYWGRRAPILFPIVGKVWGGQYRVGGRSYQLDQHGFARDREFTPIDCDGEVLRLRLVSDEETLRCFPYPFELEAEYILRDATAVCRWHVRNTGDEPMFFQIGAHPAFNYPDFNAEDVVHGYLEAYNHDNRLAVTMVSNLDSDGYVMPGRHVSSLPEGQYPLMRNTFDNDAHLMENSQTDRIVLLDKQRRPHLEVSFPGAQVVGLWSPKGKNAPFVCIEPWLGRADREGFEGDITQRDWIQCLAAGAETLFEYQVTLL